MQHDLARNVYLETQVNTATPQKLRLMLIEGAIRLARRTAELWQSGDQEQAFESLIRCREIVSELLVTVRPSSGELPRTMAAVYVFIFRTLTEAQHNHEVSKLLAAVQVLEEERETWRLLCEQYPHDPAPAMRTEAEEITHAAVPGEAADGSEVSAPVERFSLDA